MVGLFWNVYLKMPSMQVCKWWCSLNKVQRFAFMMTVELLRRFVVMVLFCVKPFQIPVLLSVDLGNSHFFLSSEWSEKDTSVGRTYYVLYYNRQYTRYVFSGILRSCFNCGEMGFNYCSSWNIAMSVVFVNAFE